jgi:hypothetical protein
MAALDWIADFKDSFTFISPGGSDSWFEIGSVFQDFLTLGENVPFSSDSRRVVWVDQRLA